jgi:hypothetical protein
MNVKTGIATDHFVVHRVCFLEQGLEFVFAIFVNETHDLCDKERADATTIVALDIAVVGFQGFALTSES